MSEILDMSEVISGVQEYGIKALMAVHMYSETAAKKMENYAKLNKPWTDRTGRARQGLTGGVEKTQTGFNIYIAHTVSYGVDLEFKHGKKYAILEPTLNHEAVEILRGMSGILERL